LYIPLSDYLKKTLELFSSNRFKQEYKGVAGATRDRASKASHTKDKNLTKGTPLDRLLEDTVLMLNKLLDKEESK